MILKARVMLNQPVLLKLQLKMTKKSLLLTHYFVAIIRKPYLDPLLG